MGRFRYWLADLISGGELTRIAIGSATYAEDGWKTSQTFAKRCDNYRAALARIAADVKPTSNATVKRMGRIASEALK